MELTKYRLGDLIQRCSGGNEDLRFGMQDVRGVSVKKEFMTTKADLGSVSLSNYTVVEPGCFSFVTVTSRNGDKISIAFNRSNESFITSPFYVTFKLSDYGKERLIEEYLFMYYNRDEFDRFSRFNSWGSARETFAWDDMCDVEIELPPLEIQQKYVAIYEAMIANQHSFAQGVDDLKLICDAYIEHLRKSSSLMRLGPHIEQNDSRNSGLLGKESVRGISTDKAFIDTKANLNGVSLTSYKVVPPGSFAYVADTSRRGDKISLALNDSEEPYLVSSISIVFRTKETIDPSYLMLFFNRDEFDRYARFNSWGSAREAFTWDDMCDVMLPIPSRAEQRALVGLYKSYIVRKRISEQLRAQLDGICPVLIKGSIDEAGRRA